MPVTNEQLAELLVGIARSQKAIIDAVAQHLGQNGNAFRMGAVVPTLQGYANVANHHAPPTLHDLPTRILLQIQGTPRPGAQPVEDWVEQQLARIVGP
ncbi:hypothetical protein [Paraburkholderia sp.]|uniref:hypothetical protein n=1 Tax=Paraburkholderia sp. TaxID=1926495 RepID=UPI0039E42FB3